MANRLALTTVTIRDALGAVLFEKVSARSEGSTVEIRNGGQVLLTITDVVDVTRFTAGSFKITTTDTSYLVDVPRGGGCNCGR